VRLQLQLQQHLLEPLRLAPHHPLSIWLLLVAVVVVATLVAVAQVVLVQGLIKPFPLVSVMPLLSVAVEQVVQPAQLTALREARLHL
jgi:hypothetical protein